MAGKYEAPRKRPVLLPLLAVLAVLAAAGLFLWPRDGAVPETQTPAASHTPTTVTAPAETTEPPVTRTASATISAQGDLLMHKPVIRSCKQEDGSYDFSGLFQYLREYVESYDYAAVNLETTLGGPDYPYQGNPEFNCPDSVADALKEAGYDLVLTANNHSSDTYTSGILRTLEQLRSRNLTPLGTMSDGEEKKYALVDVNGIRLGMLCYTYATNEISEGKPSLNYREFVKTAGIVNYFLETKPERLLEEVRTHIADMKADGAEAIVMYLHWGKEYFTTPNDFQKDLAQKLCDLGVDVIIGSHPHVLQPVQLLESATDPEHKTVCLYSLGNLVSNQMKDEAQVFKSGHSEDGAIFSVTFEKYSDGTVKIASVDLLPTWVNRNENQGQRRYDVLPLDIAKEDRWQSLYGLTEQLLSAAKESYNRTMAIVEAGLAQCRAYFAEQ